jgi:antitoxin ChpS
MVAIPPAAMNELGISSGSALDVEVRDGELILRPTQKRTGRIGLAARLAMCDFTKPMSETEREWLDSPRVGREEI